MPRPSTVNKTSEGTAGMRLRVPVAAIAALGFLLRVWHINAQSACSPEIISVYAALIATLIFAVSQAGVVSSQEARPYSQLVFSFAATSSARQIAAVR